MDHLDTLVTSLANHLTSENDMRSRYKRKKTDIEQAFNRAVVQLQEQKLPKEGTSRSLSRFLIVPHLCVEYKKQLDEKTAEFRREIDALDEEIRNVQVLFIEAYKK
jgi:hypothetical protein